MVTQAQKPSDRLKDYITVAERISQFYGKHPNGRIVTVIANLDLETGFVLVRAEVFRVCDDAQPSASGHAYEYRNDGPVQKTSFIEVAETSAVGRALAMLGFEAKRTPGGRASRAEAPRSQQPREVSTASSAPQPQSGKWFDECISLIARLKDAGDTDFADTKSLVAHIRRVASAHKWTGMITELSDLTEERLEIYAGVLTDKLAAIHSV